MTAFLRRSHAPLAQESWDVIDEQARALISATVSARKIVGVSGPHGAEYASLNLGKLDPTSIDAGDGVYYGLRKVLPLVEVRVPFVLDLWALDDVVRGSRDPELEPLLDATSKLVAFEEHAIYDGLARAGIVGLRDASPHPRQRLSADVHTWPQSIARATSLLRLAGIQPPYVLVASPRVVEAIEHHAGEYPLRKQIEGVLLGEIMLAPHVDGAFLLPASAERELELVLGQDISIGFEQQHGQALHLYLTESFTFRAIEPQAVIAFELSHEPTGAS